MSQWRFFVLCVAALASSAAWSAGVVVSSGAVSVPEGGTNTFTVRLDAAPAADVEIAVSRTSGDSDISVGPTGSSWPLLAGDEIGFTDKPYAVAIDAAGNLYIADAGADRIQKRDTGGHWTAWGSYGSAVGKFDQPRGLAVDAAGNLYVADANNDRIQKRDTSGTWTAIGSTGSARGQFNYPMGVAVDAAGNLYVADTFNYRIQKRDTTGTWSVWGSEGTGLGQFEIPGGVLADAAGSVYVGDTGNDRVQKRDASGNWTAWGVPGERTLFFYPHHLAMDSAGRLYVADGNHGHIMRLEGGVWSELPNPAKPIGFLATPYGVATDSLGNLYVADTGNMRILKRSTAGAWTIESGSKDAVGQLVDPLALAVGGASEIYVADSGNNRIQVRASDGTWTAWGSYGTAAGQFNRPAAVALSTSGALYVADMWNNRVQVRSTAGVWTVVGAAGTGLGQFDDPDGVAVDSAGNLYVAELANDRIQKRDAAGVWTVVASSGSALGQVTDPKQMTIDSAGSLYVADAGNDRIQKRDTAGSWTGYGTSGVGVGRFESPIGVAVDASGAIYVSDAYGSVIQRRDPSGIWTVIGGQDVASRDPISSGGLAFDAAGALYLADTGANSLRKWCPGLVFTPSNWATAQTVTLAAAEDADWDDGVATVRCEAGGGASAGIAPATVTATEIDNDRQNIVTTLSAVTVPEAGTATFGVKLSKAPTANVSVSVSRTSGDNNLSVTAGATLTFTTANWNTAQTVTVGATDDADAVNGAATISASASGWAAASVTATEADNDLRLVVSPSAVSVPEGGSATYGVSLAGQPGGEVKVGTVRQSGDTSLTISAGAALTFTAANWSVPQTVRVAAASDADTANGSATLVSSATGWATASVTATEADDDMRIVATPTSLSVPEGGTATYALVLAGPPAANVTVSTARLSGDADLTVDLGASLTFTTSNWNVPKTVRLRGASDADAASGSALFRASAPGWSSADVTATELDDEMRIVAAPTSVSVAEGGTSTFAVSLGGAPASSVVVRTTRLSGDPSLAVDLGAALTFTAANWSMPQTVRLRATDDADAISGTAVMQSAAAGWASANVTATAADNDLRILATPTSLTVPEAGAGTYAVTLAGAPASSVTVSTARIGGDSSLAVAAGAALTFTAGNWNLPQTVRIAAAADSDMANGVALFKSSATGWTSVTVTATEADDDKRLVVSANAVIVPENGSVTYSLRLGAKPPSNVTVTTSRSGGDSSVSVDLGAQLTFTPANWNVMQTVRLRAADDVDAIGSKATLRSSASGWAAASVTATEADDDLRIVVSATAVAVPEGGTATYKVRLAGQPSANVTVKVARVAGDSNVSVDLGAALTFTPSNWKAGQTVRLRAAADTDALNGIATIRASSSGWLSAEVRATEIDTRSASETVPIDPCDEPWPLSPRDAWSRLGVRGAAPVCIAFRQLWYE